MARIRTRTIEVIAGTKFARWTAIGATKVGPGWVVLCRCDCGKKRRVGYQSLRAGTSKSCGCYRKEHLSELNSGEGHYNYKHGMSKSPTHNSWSNMLTRTSNPKANGYENWGGRGIKVCDRWLGENGFMNFLADMGLRPEGTTLDRIEVDGDYEPGNCKWATPTEQVNNRRCSVKEDIALEEDPALTC